MDIYEILSSTKLDDDVKIGVVLRESPQKLRDYLLVSSQQFERNYNKLRAIIQAYLNTNKTWTLERTDPVDVDDMGKSKGKKQEQEQWEQQKRQQRQGQEQRKEQGPQPRQGHKQEQQQRQRQWKT